MKKYSNDILLIKFVTILLVNWNLFAVTSYLLQGSISNLVAENLVEISIFFQPVLSFTKPICFQSLHVYMVALFLITQEFYLKV